MKLVIRSVSFHVLCIVVFGLIYFLFRESFAVVSGFSPPKKTALPSLLDCVFLATTVQAGVGIVNMTPDTSLTKILLLLQQISMIFTNLFALYIFTL